MESAAILIYIYVLYEYCSLCHMHTCSCSNRHEAANRHKHTFILLYVNDNKRYVHTTVTYKQYYRLNTVHCMSYTRHSSYGCTVVPGIPDGTSTSNPARSTYCSMFIGRIGVRAAVITTIHCLVPTASLLGPLSIRPHVLHSPTRVSVTCDPNRHERHGRRISVRDGRSIPNLSCR